MRSMTRLTVQAMVAALAMGVAVTTARPAVGSGAFSNFEGRWNGSGSVFMANGTRESIRCRADNATGVGSLHLNVTCASDSYHVNIVADLRAQGDGFSGSWQETTRQVGGEVVGTVPRAGQIRASLQTLGGGMQLGATSDGKRQAISIRSQGTEVQSAEITLTRR